MIGFGVILGDIIGNYYENNSYSEDELFPLIKDNSSFSDETVLYCSSIDFLISSNNHDDYLEYLIKWTSKYPEISYGMMFKKYLESKDHKPYNSIGNGSLIRIIPFCLALEDLDFLKELAFKTNDLTHKSNDCHFAINLLIEVIDILKRSKNKDDIYHYILNEFEIDLKDKSIEDNYKFTYSSTETLLISLYYFINNNDLINLIKKIIKLNGDCDTILAVAISLFELVTPLDKSLVEEALFKLLQEMKELIDKFRNYYKLC